jgi:hypothetical protein
MLKQVVNVVTTVLQMVETRLRACLTFSRQNPVFNKISGMTILVPRIL